MTVHKTKDGWETVHCHGEDKGTRIAKFDTKKEALAQHRAIMSSKMRATHKKKRKRSF